MKILIAGGGTGGHVYPALALARYALAEDEKNKVVFVGTARGLESRIVPEAGFPLETITATGFQRRLRQIPPLVRDLWLGFRQCGTILKRHHPAVVLGTGGYVAAPLALAALLRRYPLVLHEQNYRPGLTNRYLAPYASRVCLSFKETARALPRRTKVTWTGNPRASEVTRIERAEGCRIFGLDPGKMHFLVYGGSRGASKINEVMVAFLASGQLPENLEVLYITGEEYYDSVREKLGQLPPGVQVFPYLYRMPEALAAADLALTRSGATTLAELTALGLPAILVPSPNVVDNHQYHNARLLADAGAALLIEEDSFNPQSLTEAVQQMLSENEKLKLMAHKSRRLGMGDAAARLYHCLKEAAG